MKEREKNRCEGGQNMWFFPFSLSHSHVDDYKRRNKGESNFLINKVSKYHVTMEHCQSVPKYLSFPSKKLKRNYRYKKD